MTRILIADDHEMIRDGLCRIIEEDPTMSVVGCASSGAEALELSRRLRPDVVLLDLVMPGRDSLEIVDELKSWGHGIRILMLTAHSEELYALRCLQAGADGFLSKANAGETLLDAIRNLRTDGKYISDSLATLLAVSIGHDQPGAPHERLSAREFQVMRLMG
ncbi:MAG: response regulator transcription factor, partial [Thermoanaerobaculia bacterium]